MDSQDSLNYWLCGAHCALLFSLKSVFPVFHWQRQRPGECQLFEKVRLGYATHFDGGGRRIRRKDRVSTVSRVFILDFTYIVHFQ